MSSLGIFDKETKTYKKVADLSKTAVIDSAMSDSSTNAVQNKVVKKYVDGRTSSVAWNNVTGKPSTYPPNSHTHTKSQITDFPSSLPANGGNSATANSVIDYADANSNIKIGYTGTGISGDGIKYIAGYTTGDGNSVARIKDIAKGELKSWLGDATTSDHGLMTPAMVSKLNGIADGANRTTVDSAMSDSSTNPVQNKVVKKYVDGTQTGYYVGSNPPENTNLLWVDLSRGGMIKYFASETSKWHPVRAKGYDAPVDLINEGYWSYSLGTGITVDNISATYDINKYEVTITIKNLSITSEAFVGPNNMLDINMPIYNLGHTGSIDPVTVRPVSGDPIDMWMVLDYPYGRIQTGPPYGIYKPATMQTIIFRISNIH